MEAKPRPIQSGNRGTVLIRQRGNNFCQIRISISCNLLMKAKQCSERDFIAQQN